MIRGILNLKRSKDQSLASCYKNKKTWISDLKFDSHIWQMHAEKSQKYIVSYQIIATA